MRPVDVFIVGQPKSGTTALARFLDEHPGIDVSRPKEPGWFGNDLREVSIAAHGGPSRLVVPDAAAYERCFAHASDDSLLVDASTSSLYSSTAAAEIHAHHPEARIVALLRDPVTMIASLHRQYLNETTEDIADLEAALDAESDRARGLRVPARAPVPAYLLYTRRGRYSEQLERYLTTFGREAVLVATANDLRRAPSQTYRSVLEHIRARDTSFQPDFRDVHTAARPRSAAVNRMLRSPAITGPARRLLGAQRYTAVQKRVVEPALMRQHGKDELPTTVVERLRDALGDDLDRTSRLVGRDLRKEWWSA